MDPSILLLMGTLSRSWDMIGESFAVLRQDKKLVLFPILSGLSTLAVAAMYFLPLFHMGVLEKYEAYRTVDSTVYAWLFLWYCTNYFVIIFFNCALAACAQIRFGGGEPTLRAGMAQAGWRIPSILMWAVVASTVIVLILIGLTYYRLPWRKLPDPGQPQVDPVPVIVEAAIPAPQPAKPGAYAESP